uniref:mechanosensitive ion channel family protein n=1 Tax=Eubacterium cellulosolvens TaxID=29322 RepID=UPI0006841D7E|nr:mechanosensitive ion channel domain-containing protein [[Eubacterium] cellulosolvens]
MLQKLETWALKFGGEAFDFLIRAAGAILIFWIVGKILRKFCSFLERRMAKHNVDASIRSFVCSLIRYGILSLTLVEIIIQLRIVEATSIAALLASAGVGISLAMQGTLANFAGGLLLLVVRPFRSGDYIQVPAVSAEGTVRKIEMYYTTLETVYHEIVMIPNSTLTNNRVTNVTALGRRKIEIRVGISYSADVEAVRAVIERILDADSRIEKGGRKVFVAELGESAVILGIWCFVNASEYLPVKWALNESIHSGFAKEGIEIPYRQVVLHMAEKTETA